MCDGTEHCFGKGNDGNSPLTFCVPPCWSEMVLKQRQHDVLLERGQADAWREKGHRPLSARLALRAILGQGHHFAVEHSAFGCQAVDFATGPAAGEMVTTWLREIAARAAGPDGQLTSSRWL